VFKCRRVCVVKARGSTDWEENKYSVVYRIVIDVVCDLCWARSCRLVVLFLSCRGARVCLRTGERAPSYGLGARPRRWGGRLRASAEWGGVGAAIASAESIIGIDPSISLRFTVRRRRRRRQVVPRRQVAPAPTVRQRERALAVGGFETSMSCVRGRETPSASCICSLTFGDGGCKYIENGMGVVWIDRKRRSNSRCLRKVPGALP